MQGGGSHGAFTWGVLDPLLEDDRTKLKGICGTSARAINAAALAHGMTMGGATAARETLDRFWDAVAQAARFSPIQRLERLLGTWRFDYAPSYTIFDYVTRMLSPCQTNPSNYNLLERVLEEVVDFDVVLMREMRTIAFVGRLVESGKLDHRAYKRMNIHLVETDEQIRALEASSKLNAERGFLEHLRTSAGGRRLRSLAGPQLRSHRRQFHRRSGRDVPVSE